MRRSQCSTAKNKQLKAIYQTGHETTVTLFGYALKRPCITNLLEITIKKKKQMLFPPGYKGPCWETATSRRHQRSRGWHWDSTSFAAGKNHYISHFSVVLVSILCFNSALCAAVWVPTACFLEDVKHTQTCCLSFALSVYTSVTLESADQFLTDLL